MARSSSSRKSKDSALQKELDSITSLADVEARLLPLLRDDFDAALVVFYLLGRGPLEILHLGGTAHLGEDLVRFHHGPGAKWLKRAVKKGPILGARCGMNAEEFKSSPPVSVLRDTDPEACRGLVVTVDGRPRGVIALFRSSRQSTFTKKDEAQLADCQDALASLFARLVHDRSAGAPVPASPLNQLEEGITVFDEQLRITYANAAGWSHLKKICRKDTAWLTMPAPLIRQLRLLRELSYAPPAEEARRTGNPVIVKAPGGEEIRFRGFHGVQDEGERPFYYLISSTVRTLPAASVEQVARRMGLTPREREVCAMLVEGKRNRVIAETFGITEHTVKIHVRRILGKMNCISRSEVPGAVLKALTRWQVEDYSEV